MATDPVSHILAAISPPWGAGGYGQMTVAEWNETETTLPGRLGIVIQLQVEHIFPSRQ